MIYKVLFNVKETDYSKYKVSELKAKLKEFGLDQKGNKSTLLEKLISHTSSLPFQ